MFSLIHVRAHGHNAAYTRGIRLRRPRARCMHDRVLCGAEKVGRSTEPIEHSRAHHTRAVGVGVDVDFQGRVHTNNAQSADNLRRI